MKTITINERPKSSLESSDVLLALRGDPDAIIRTYVKFLSGACAGLGLLVLSAIIAIIVIQVGKL